jgi:hypothetical protein
MLLHEGQHPEYIRDIINDTRSHGTLTTEPAR